MAVEEETWMMGWRRKKRIIEPVLSVVINWIVESLNPESMSRGQRAILSCLRVVYGSGGHFCGRRGNAKYCAWFRRFPPVPHVFGFKEGNCGKKRKDLDEVVRLVVESSSISLK